MKNQVDRIVIESNLLKELKKLKIAEYPKEYYLTSTADTIMGPSVMSSDKAYKHFVKALKILGLQGKGYNLYSFKHYSNIQRFKGGWNLAEIMVANRHSSIAMTEKYLKNINRETDISKKEVPSI